MPTVEGTSSYALSANPLLSKLSDAKKCPHSFWTLVTLIIVGAYASKHLHSSLFKEAAAMSCVLLPILSKDVVICKDKPGETMGTRKKMRKNRGKGRGRLNRETVAVNFVDSPQMSSNKFPLLQPRPGMHRVLCMFLL